MKFTYFMAHKNHGQPSAYKRLQNGLLDRNVQSIEVVINAIKFNKPAKVRMS